MKLNKFLVFKIACLECYYGKSDVVGIYDTEEEAEKVAEESEKKNGGFRTDFSFEIFEI